VGLGEGALDLLRDLLRDFGWLKPRPKKRQKSKPVRPQLPGRPPPLPLRTTRVLPIQLQIGDRMTDSTGEWKWSGDRTPTRREERSRAGPAGEPAGRDRDEDVGSAYEKVSVRRTTAEERKRSFQSLPECKRAAQSDDAMKMLAESRRVEAAITAVCLPDTVDPRRPKGR
jgi:hypothetical protein